MPHLGHHRHPEAYPSSLDSLTISKPAYSKQSTSFSPSHNPYFAISTVALCFQFEPTPNSFQSPISTTHILSAPAEPKTSPLAIHYTCSLTLHIFTLVACNLIMFEVSIFPIIFAAFSLSYSPASLYSGKRVVYIFSSIRSYSTNLQLDTDISFQKVLKI